jgi:hypothetical protein
MGRAGALDGVVDDDRRGFATNAAGGAKAEAAEAKNSDTATVDANFMVDWTVNQRQSDGRIVGFGITLCFLNLPLLHLIDGKIVDPRRRRTFARREPRICHGRDGAQNPIDRDDVQRYLPL